MTEKIVSIGELLDQVLDECEQLRLFLDKFDPRKEKDINRLKLYQSQLSDIKRQAYIANSLDIPTFDDYLRKLNNT